MKMMTYDKLYEIIRGTGYVTRQQAHEIAELILAEPKGAPAEPSDIDALLGKQVWFDRKDVKATLTRALAAADAPKGEPTAPKDLLQELHALCETGQYANGGSLNVCDVRTIIDRYRASSAGTPHGAREPNE